MMLDCLSLEIRFSEKGMKHGLRGCILERYVCEMHQRFSVPRVPEPRP